jgi:hypothetical protein
MLKYFFSSASNTVREVLRDNGRIPGGDRTKRVKWRQFIESHLDVLCSTDFFTIELLTLKSLKRVTVMFVVELSTRRVHLTGLTSKPCGEWMDQMARNLTDCMDGFLKGKRYLIHDRDPLFTKSTPTPPFSMLQISSQAVSQACTKSFDDKASWKEFGVSIRMKLWAQASSKKSIASTLPLPIRIRKSP